MYRGENIWAQHHPDSALYYVITINSPKKQLLKQGLQKIAIVYKSKLSLVKVTAGERSFEFAEYIVPSGTDKIRLIVIYRARYSFEHRVTISTFLEGFADHTVT